MKKKIALFIGLLAVSVSLVACGEVSVETVEVKAPSGFTIITSDKIRVGHATVIQHNGTRCNYTMTMGNFDTTVGIAQMFVKENGVSVPYCD